MTPATSSCEPTEIDAPSNEHCQVLGHLGAGDAQCRQLLLQRRYDAEAAQPVRAAAAYVLEAGGLEEVKWSSR